MIPDDNHCYYCHRKLDNTKIDYLRNPLSRVYDHVFPQTLGGTWKKSNMVIACRHCNNVKNGVHPLYFFENNDFEHWGKDQIEDFKTRVEDNDYNRPLIPTGELHRADGTIIKRNIYHAR